MQEFFQRLQDSEFSAAILGSESIWSFPTILTAHTVGLAMLVAASLVINLRALGVGTDFPSTLFRVLVQIIWIGFVINLISGVILFICMAADRSHQAMFGYKLLSIVIALVLGQIVIARTVTGPQAGSAVAGSTRLFAAATIAMWMVAILAGRLMAYVK